MYDKKWIIERGLVDGYPLCCAGSAAPKRPADTGGIYPRTVDKCGCRRLIGIIYSGMGQSQRTYSLDKIELGGVDWSMPIRVWQEW